eukprot:Nitzschia sp. Nitz4//scaffold257_size48314//1355//2389//NITZ4_007083-RA/size48314-processed-gene-0.40-mRNA-1//-1//CDS//3329544430//4166//frame0
MIQTVVTKRSTSTTEFDEELGSQLGQGAMRFGPVIHNAAIRNQVKDAHISEKQIYVFAEIKASYDVDNDKTPKNKRLTNQQVFQIAQYCNFDEPRIMKLLKNTRRRYFELSAFDLSDQLLSKTLFPCPGLMSKEGYDTIYMRPSRHFVNETRTRDVIDNLVYVMNHVHLRNPKGKIAFLANMDDWTMSNFSTTYCAKFMKALQGGLFPAEVSLFIILNPPSWFGKIWKFMKTVLSPEFVKKVVMISDDELPYYMDLDYERYLPDEIPGGEVNTDELVQDFVSFCKGQDLLVNGRSSDSKRGMGTLFSKMKIRTGFWRRCQAQKDYDVSSSNDASESGTISSSRS